METRETTVVTSFDKSILQMPPNVAIEVGFAMYTADSEHATPTVKQAAALAVSDFTAQLQKFAVDAQERIYLGSLLRAAISFARGIKRRKDELSHNLGNLEVEKDRALATIVDSERSSGFLMGGMQLLMIGGVVWFLSQGLSSIPGVSELLKGNPNGPNYFSLAFALASALIGSFVKHWKMSRDLRKLFRWYEVQRDGAYHKYSESVRQEYELAAETATLAWQTLTGETPNVTRAFAQLLEGIFPDYRGVHSHKG